MAFAARSSTTVLVSWCKKSVELSLKETELCFIEDGKTVRSVNLEDVIGLKVIEKPGHGGQNFCQTELHTFALDQKLTKPKRMMTFIPIVFDNGDSFETNKEAALEFRREIQIQCLKNDQRSLMGIQDGDPVQPCFLVVINPSSGRKQGVNKYRQDVQPFFEIAGVTVVEELVTERQNHAKEFIQTFDFSRITGIIVIGGDGTTFEIVNGIMCRSDGDAVLKTPIGIIPTGSGNAVVSSLLYERGEEYSILNAVYQVLRGGVQSIDLATVTTPNNTYYMFTTFTWGIIADIDIESETMRFLGGEIRNLLGALKCILRKRAYSGRFSYMPVKNDDSTTNNVCTDNGKETSQGNDNQQEEATINDQDNDQLQSVSKEDEPDSNSGKGLEENPLEADNSKIQATANNITENTSSLPTAAPNTAPSSSILPPLTDPIPNGWVTVEGDIVSVLVGMTPRITTNFFGHPNAVLGDGNFYLAIMDNSITRGELLRVMTGMETGEYVNYPFVNIVQTRACRIEPMSETGRIVVDGEEVNYGPIQMEINKSINIFSRKKTPS